MEEQQSITWGQGIFIAIGFAILGLFVWGALFPPSDDTEQGQGAAQTAPEKEFKGLPEIGEEGTLRGMMEIGGEPIVVLATSKAALDEFISAGMAKDKYGLSELIGQGKVFSVPPGTRAKYLEAHWTGGMRVRVLSGPDTGEAGWIPVEFFERSSSQ